LGDPFDDLNNFDDWFLWVREVYLPKTYDATWYNGEPYTDDEIGTIGLQTQFVGGFRASQQRSLLEGGDNCFPSYGDNIFTRCLSEEFDTAPMDRPNVTEWNKNVSLGLYPAMWYMDGFEYTMKNGYSAYQVDFNFDETLEDGLHTLQCLFENRWLDEQTTKVSLDASL
jgi:hypothetical protein